MPKKVGLDGTTFMNRNGHISSHYHFYMIPLNQEKQHLHWQVKQKICSQVIWGWLLFLKEVFLKTVKSNHKKCKEG